MSDVNLENYKPSDEEEYMNERQLAYFRDKLLKWKKELHQQAEDTVASLQQENLNEPDLNDRATAEADTAFELRTRDRYRKLLEKIDYAIKRIDNGEYGYCEETDEPIGLNRLEARPIATLCIEAQERHENREKFHADKDDRTTI